MKVDTIREALKFLVENSIIESATGEEKLYNEKYNSIAKNLSDDFLKKLNSSGDFEKFLTNHYMKDTNLSELREERKKLLSNGDFDDYNVRAEINAKVDFYNLIEGIISSEISNKK